jgi:hypothetical protein
MHVLNTTLLHTSNGLIWLYVMEVKLNLVLSQTSFEFSVKMTKTRKLWSSKRISLKMRGEVSSKTKKEFRTGSKGSFWIQASDNYGWNLVLSSVSSRLLIKWGLEVSVCNSWPNYNWSGVPDSHYGGLQL